MAMQSAIQRAFPHAVRCGHPVEHAGAVAVRGMIGSEYRLFAVVRNPWRIFEGHWRWVRQYSRDPPTGWEDDIVYGLLAESRMTFDEVVAHCIQHDVLATDGGFYMRYCDASTTVFRYEDSPWQDLSDALGRHLSGEIENACWCDPPVWSRRAVEQVARYCCDDIVRFGYTFTGRTRP